MSARALSQRGTLTQPGEKATFALGELAYAENITGTTTSATSAALVDIPGTTITVPPSPQPVYLEAQMSVTVTALTATGHVNAAVAEINNGVDAALLLGFATAVTINGQTVNLSYRVRVGPTARQRQFKLQIGLHSGVTARSMNSTAGPTSLMARAR